MLSESVLLTFLLPVVVCRPCSSKADTFEKKTRLFQHTRVSDHGKACKLVLLRVAFFNMQGRGSQLLHSVTAVASSAETTKKTGSSVMWCGAVLFGV